MYNLEHAPELGPDLVGRVVRPVRLGRVDDHPVSRPAIEPFGAAQSLAEVVSSVLEGYPRAGLVERVGEACMRRPLLLRQSAECRLNSVEGFEGEGRGDADVHCGVPEAELKEPVDAYDHAEMQM